MRRYLDVSVKSPPRKWRKIESLLRFCGVPFSLLLKIGRITNPHERLLIGNPDALWNLEEMETANGLCIQFRQLRRPRLRSGRECPSPGFGRAEHECLAGLTQVS